MDEATKKSIHTTLLNATVKIWVDGEFQGTGFFIAPDGHVLTAYHCIGKPPPKQIVIETRFNGKFVAQLDNHKSLPDIKYDIAVLEIFGNYQPAEYLPLGFIDNQHCGDDIVALGCPAGANPENTQIGLYFGKISRLRSDNRFENDAMKGTGQSGGPVYHYATHRVIGLAAAVYDPAVMVNSGLSVRFESLFERWFALADQNIQVAKAWDERLKLSSPANERTDYVQLQEELAATRKNLEEAQRNVAEQRAMLSERDKELAELQQLKTVQILPKAGIILRDKLKDGSEGPEIVVILAGQFMTGEDNEKLAHQVTIAHNFAMSKYPVTFDDYDLFCQKTKRGKPDDEGWGRSKRPVINISWEDAIAYCEWLSKQTHQHYRLPNEAEWEYACRAGTTTRYSFGDDENKLPEYAWFSNNSGNQTHPVGEKEPNPWGVVRYARKCLGVV